MSRRFVILAVMILELGTVIKKLSTEETFFDDLFTVKTMDVVLQVKTTLKTTTAVGFWTEKNHF